MIGVDTNVLLRAHLEDDQKSAIIAQRFLSKITAEKQLFISSYAILEMVWVLKTLKIPRAIICESVLDLLDSPGVVVGNRDIIFNALAYYQKGQADFGDYLILAEGEVNHAPQLASFDKKLCQELRRCCSPEKFLQ